MPKVSKKKQFHGKNRWNTLSPISSSELASEPVSSSTSTPYGSTPVNETASIQKITSQNNDRREDFNGEYGYRPIELSNLANAFQSLHNCESGGELKVTDDEARRYGNSAVIIIECSKCDTKIELQTLGNKNQGWNPKSSIDINRRMVYSAMEMGVGRDGMSVMCDIFNMPPPCHPNAWKNHVTALYEAHKKAVSEQLQEARDKVFSRHSDNESDVAEIAVSYDGTWSKRGYTANFGIGFVISADTGEVLDYDFESKICRECQIAKKDLGEDSPEFDIWFGGHQEQCTQTHTGSSGSEDMGQVKGEQSAL